MLVNYMLVFALAMLSIIAIEDLNVSRFMGVTVSHSKLMQNKLSRRIKRLRVSLYVIKRKVRRT